MVNVAALTLKGWRDKIEAGEEDEIPPLQSPTRRKLVLSKQAFAQQNGNGEGAVEGVPPGVEPGSDLEREWIHALRDIRASSAPRHQKMMDMDALASVIGRIAWARAERAAEERARAVRSGDEAGEVRARTEGVRAPKTSPRVREADEGAVGSGGGA